MRIPNLEETEAYFSKFNWAIRSLDPQDATGNQWHRFEVIDADGELHDRYRSLQAIWEEWIEFGKAIVSVEWQVKDFAALFVEAEVEQRERVLDHLADYFEDDEHLFLDEFLDKREISQASDLPKEWPAHVASHLRTHGRLLDFYDLVLPALVAADAVTFDHWRAKRGWRQAR